MSAMRWSHKLATLLGTAPEAILYEDPASATTAAERYRLAVGLSSTEHAPDLNAERAAEALELPQALRGAKVALGSSFSFKHPLAGCPQSIPLPDSVGHAQDVVAQALDGLQLLKDGSEHDYLKVWRLLPLRLREQDAEHARFWTLLPTSRATPSYSYWVHSAMAAAIAGAGKRPALFLFTIASAQDFIGAARRTQDLWIGSYVLSYLSWTAMRVIVERYGPDALIFPNLREQPVVDWWLHTDKGLTEISLPQDDALSIANVPNLFTAVVDAEDDLDSLAQDCIDAVTQKRDAMAVAVARKFAEFAGRLDVTWDGQARQLAFYRHGQKDSALSATWNRHITELLASDIYWSAYAWNETLQEAEAAFNGVIPPDDRHTNDLRHFSSNGIGAAYPLMSRLASRALDARKNLRDFAQQPEPNWRCSQCAQREALHPDNVAAYPRRFEPELKRFWEGVQERSYGQIRAGDRLCAVCVVKRLVAGVYNDAQGRPRGPVYFDGRRAPKIAEGFPSTTSIAVAKFKEHLVRAIAQHEVISNEGVQQPLSDNRHRLLQAALQNYVDHMKAFASGSNFEFTLKTAPLPRARRFAGNDTTLNTFLVIDGDWLFEESFEPDKLRREYGVTQLDRSRQEHALAALRHLLSVVKDVRDKLRHDDVRWAIAEKPHRYLAILAADGDHMGDWVNGTQLRTQEVTYGALLNETVTQALGSGHPILDTPRFMSPSLHYAMSTALSHYAVKVVRHVVEERYGGKLVYAGADDVKALLPIEDALPVMQELQLLFRGAGGSYADTGLSRPLESGDGFVHMGGDVLMMMGTKATTSIGVAIVHHAHPLTHAIEQSAAALNDGAKEGQAFAVRGSKGRDAFAVYLFKRSGEALQVGAKWGSGTTGQIVPMLQQLVRAFQSGWLSSKLAYRMYDDRRVYTSPRLEEAAQAELRRLFHQHTEGLKRDDPHWKLQEELQALLRDPCIGWEGVARLLLLARFIAQEGRE